MKKFFKAYLKAVESNEKYDSDGTPTSYKEFVVGCYNYFNDCNYDGEYDIYIDAIEDADNESVITEIIEDCSQYYTEENYTGEAFKIKKRTEFISYNNINNINNKNIIEGLGFLDFYINNTGLFNYSFIREFRDYINFKYLTEIMDIKDWNKDFLKEMQSWYLNIDWNNYHKYFGNMNYSAFNWLNPVYGN